MLTFDETLAHLLGWIGEDVRVMVQPNIIGEDTPVLAYLPGRLDRGLDSDDDVFVFVVKPDEMESDNLELTSHFVVRRDRFTSARLQGPESLVISLGSVAITVRLAQQGS